MIRSILLFLFILVVEACVDRLDIRSIDQETGTLVIEGQITDQPGPYRIRVFRSAGNEDNLANTNYLNTKVVTIFDDQGNSEVLSKNEEGVFETAANGIRGEVGRKYAVRVEMLDGKIFESTPDELISAGDIEEIKTEWESLTPLTGPSRDGFRVFLDSRATGPGSFVRWRFSGVYMLEAFPQKRRLNDANCGNNPPPPDPPECSGWRYEFVSRFNPFAGGQLIEFGDCTCCLCWVTDNEKSPNINEDVVATDGSYKNIQVGYIPFNQWTFGRGRYMVKVEQMSLTEQAFKFWKVVKDQKDGTGSLFQPAFGKATTNLFAVNNDESVLGFFYASAVVKKVLFLGPEDAPIKVPQPSQAPSDNCTLWNSCERLISFNASRIPPPEWD